MIISISGGRRATNERSVETGCRPGARHFLEWLSPGKNTRSTTALSRHFREVFPRAFLSKRDRRPGSIGSRVFISVDCDASAKRLTSAEKLTLNMGPKWLKLGGNAQTTKSLKSVNSQWKGEPSWRCFEAPFGAYYNLHVCQIMNTLRRLWRYENMS